MESQSSFKKSWVSYIYLAISLAGAAFPTLANIKFMKIYGPGFDIGQFISLASNNPASQSLSLDLFFASTAFILWMAIESARLKIKNFWLVILGTFLIAIAFSAPLFLFLRERRLIELNKAN